MAASRRWKKILYEDQSVDDNYVDSSFLDELKKNLCTRKYDYWTVVRASGVVTQQISSVCIFVIVFIYMDSKILSAENLCVSVLTLTVLGYIINKLLVRRSSRFSKTSSSRTILDDLKTLLIFTGFSYGLSPVLVSLTETISTDTVYAMTTVMLLANLLFHDYGATEAAIVSQSLSLNAALFASVCLASRLNTPWHAFATVTFAIQIFAIWPVFKRNLMQSIPAAQPLLTALLGMFTFLTLLTVSTPAAILFGLVHLFINFVCPAWLISLQPYKNNIYGPWDEATIND
ncbi:hypothetical protein ACJMK2_039373 [Sinanodonta woodiana]|uniref:Phosphatidylinositol N-acetylglucosaminyltransferase subunit C n=1 Tax=Sinanodonta woodiana TaxID=1069815 RepID=A0ABD3WBU4_SINWO